MNKVNNISQTTRYFFQFKAGFIRTVHWLSRTRRQQSVIKLFQYQLIFQMFRVNLLSKTPTHFFQFKAGFNKNSSLVVKDTKTTIIELFQCQLIFQMLRVNLLSKTPTHFFQPVSEQFTKKIIIKLFQR